MESLMAKLEGMIQQGELVEAKSLFANHGSELPESVRRIVDAELFGMVMARAALVKQNSQPSRDQAIEAFHALFAGVNR